MISILSDATRLNFRSSLRRDCRHSLAVLKRNCSIGFSRWSNFAVETFRLHKQNYHLKPDLDVNWNGLFARGNNVFFNLLDINHDLKKHFREIDSISASVSSVMCDRITSLCGITAHSLCDGIFETVVQRLDYFHFQPIFLSVGNLTCL